MKICPKCAQSFADGFKYCPKDATELAKYDLRSRMYSQDEFQFLLKTESLASRLTNELADAMREMKRDPISYMIGLLRGEGGNRRRRRLLQAGMATAVIGYSSVIIIGLLVGLFKLPVSQQIADAAPPKDEPVEWFRIVIPVEKKKDDQSKTSGRGLLGGSLPQPKRAHGGGGADDKQPASRGKMPTPSLTQQINPPDLSKQKILSPSLIVPETVYVDPKFLSRLNAPIGVIGGQLEAPSRGDGKGSGIGPGKGPGYGPGEDGNTGDDKMKIGGGGVSGTDDDPFTATRTLKPTILYKEKAKYTEEARQQRVQGVVVLSVVFGADSRLHYIRVIHGLPHGLTETALAAAQLIRFRPAIHQGRPVSVRANLEYNFALY